MNRTRLLPILLAAAVGCLPLLATGAAARLPATDDAPTVVAPPAGGDSGDADGGPRIYFPEPEYDFGTVQRGAKASHNFVVRNTGDEPLKILRAKGG